MSKVLLYYACTPSPKGKIVGNTAPSMTHDLFSKYDSVMEGGAACSGIDPAMESGGATKINMQMKTRITHKHKFENKSVLIGDTLKGKLKGSPSLAGTGNASCSSSTGHLPTLAGLGQRWSDTCHPFVAASRLQS